MFQDWLNVAWRRRVLVNLRFDLRDRDFCSVLQPPWTGKSFPRLCSANAISHEPPEEKKEGPYRRPWPFQSKADLDGLVALLGIYSNNRLFLLSWLWTTSTRSSGSHLRLRIWRTSAQQLRGCPSSGTLGKQNLWNGPLWVGRHHILIHTHAYKIIIIYKIQTSYLDTIRYVKTVYNLVCSSPKYISAVAVMMCGDTKRNIPRSSCYKDM